MFNSRRKILCEDHRNSGKQCVAVEDHKNGQYYCKYCQRVLDKVLDEGQEWRSFDGNDERCRVTFSGTLQDTSTMLKGCTASSQQINAQNMKVSGYRRDFIDAFKKLQLDNSQVEHAMKVLQELMTEHANEFKGRMKKKNVEGIVLMVCQEEGIHMTLRDIVHQLGWEMKSATKSYKQLRMLLGKKSTNNLESFISKYTNAVGVGKYTYKCQVIAEDAQKFLEGKKPNTVAAVVICFVCEIEKCLTQELEIKIASACDVSVQNMKQVYKLMLEKKELFESILEKA
ncbi:TFIIB zinc-binding, putative [Entamoeba histolytica HM-1:IMSS-B]|uniref:TFIIB-type domain-containing protein n=6 Tax=Entamoeba histolytica TaxID=5759 RepID=C4LTW8_ENTH1|nr:hypothetical protein EHI_050980 [Entamoeba histolytica HM-1:IMSS]EMD43510.1 tfiib zinc-binding protein, putative [Entamoeba histolytica KU27]EMH77025.1 TFIIB zinc-binding, putative [Entamoeba histolytica HM-1:IMSS-B]EMS14435.1 TFIIB zinc-binding protein [Entamoeba histolytica HM-3:IMSS]ENY63890.1 TFIIB zinc-binding protein, putative [Entamoeba histolytica HM-1:IMSS-A]GAT92027.1 hypothetical protein CL6EHI_050980 [Entamoeba histolytica]|eukprot:XP_651102.1 hypothetical protein EHI_050980 [Entamoeba histolytica HM-1:IMSS]